MSRSLRSTPAFSSRNMRSLFSSHSRAVFSRSAFHSSFLRSIPPTLDSSDFFSSDPVPSRLMHNGRISSGIRPLSFLSVRASFLLSLVSSCVILPRSTCNARGVLAVTRIRFPVAKRWQIKFAMVWDFPVPGGPCTRTPVALRSLSTMRRCSSLDGFGKNTSPSGVQCTSPGSVTGSTSFLGPISARSANSVGISSPFSIRCLIRFKVSVRPLAERFLRMRAGAYSTTGLGVA